MVKKSFNFLHMTPLFLRLSVKVYLKDFFLSIFLSLAFELRNIRFYKKKAARKGGERAACE
ncbi:hypothetical protein E4N77_10260 [Treponema denticola]|nr:hypothetical protein E4N77_10260 [Treponema denticola]